jgi:hypothetical protein
LSVAEGTTQSADLDLQIGFFHERCWPGSGDQLLLADHLAGAFDQSGQDVEVAAAEPRWLVALEQETLCCKEPERAEREGVFRRCRLRISRVRHRSVRPKVVSPTAGQPSLCVPVERER